MFGPDVSASLTPGQLQQVVEGVRFIEKALANPVDKDALAAAMEISLSSQHDTEALKRRAADFAPEHAAERYLELLIQ